MFVHVFGINGRNLRFSNFSRRVVPFGGVQVIQVDQVLQSALVVTFLEVLLEVVILITLGKRLDRLTVEVEGTT